MRGAVERSLKPGAGLVQTQTLEGSINGVTIPTVDSRGAVVSGGEGQGRVYSMFSEKLPAAKPCTITKACVCPAGTVSVHTSFAPLA